MKTVFFALIAFALSFNAFAQGSYDATGAVKYQAKEYGAFVNSASGTLAAGAAVCLDLTADDGIAIDYCVTGFKPIGINTASCAVGARCKVQTKGMYETADLDVTQGNAVAGGAAYVHSDGSVYGDTTDDDKHPLGVFLDDASASGAAQVYIDP